MVARALGLTLLLAVGCAPSTPIGISAGVIDLAESNAVVSLLEDHQGYEEFPSAVSESGSEFTCGRSVGWQLCIVQDGGVLVAVPFDTSAGTVLQFEGDGLTSPGVVRVEGLGPFGLDHSGGGVHVTVYRNREIIGELAGVFGNPAG